MRAGADRIAPDTTHAIWQDNQQFFHRGAAASGGRCSTTTVCAGTSSESPSSPSPTSPGGCTAIAAGALTDPRSPRDHWEGHADDWIELTRSDPQFELLNKPAFLELLPAPGRLTIEVGCGEGRVAASFSHSVIG